MAGTSTGKGRGDKRGDYANPPPNQVVVISVVVVTVTAFVYGQALFRPMPPASPATIAAIQRVTIVLKAETRRELARRILREICNEAVKTAVNAIIDRTIERVLRDSLADSTETIQSDLACGEYE